MILVRKNCEYSLVVDTDDQATALLEAEATPDEDWGQAWSSFEYEVMEDDEGEEDD